MKGQRELLERVLGQLAELPVVTLGLALALVLTFLVLRIGFASHYEAAEADLAVAVEYAIENPMVEIDPRLVPAVRAVMPSFESNETFAFLKQGKGAKLGETRQQEFDELEQVALARLDLHPYRSLAVVPARPFYTDFLTYSFVHVGWIHLAASVLLLLWIAPLLEVAWGRAALIVTLACIAVAGALACWVVQPDSDQPLVGAGTALAGLTAAFLVRFHRADVAPLDWLSAYVPLELRVPSWTVGVLWAGYEGLLYWAMKDALPGQLDAAFGAPAHVAGAAVGALGAVAFARTGLESRFGSEPSVQRREARPAPSRSFDFQRVLALRARGDVDAAWAQLSAEVRRSARHRDAVVTFFQMAVERGESEVAVPAMLKLIGEELRRGTPEVAVSHWRSLAENTPKVCVAPAVLLRLIPVIREEDGDEHAALAVQQLLDRRKDPLTTVQLVDLARMAKEVDADLAAEAAHRALRAKDLRREDRPELEKLGRGLELKDEPPPVIPVPKNLPESAFYAEQDRSAFADSGADLGEITDPAALAAMGLAVPVPEVTEAVPLGLDDGVLRVQVMGKGQARIPFEHVHGVALVGVGGLAARPVALIDIVITGPPPTGRPLRVLRLRSDRYDPRPLLPDAPSVLAALQGFADSLTQHARARRFEPESGGKPVAMFEGLPDYEQECLAPAAAQLGAKG